MPPKKRKAELIEEHPSVFVGRPKILKGPDGEKIVKEYIRNNVILFFRKLKDEEATNHGGKEFQSKLDTAVRSALDPLMGPEFFTDLTKYGFEDLKLWGNKEARQLIPALLNLVDDGGGKRLGQMVEELGEKQGELDKEKENKASVENTLAYLQSLIPISQAGQKSLAKQLEALESDADAGWIYGILWNSCLQWMDARLRAVRMYGNTINNKPMEPSGFDERNQMINIRVHGGDLRVDAVICHIKFGDIRHDDSHYDVFFQDSFKRMYNLSIDDGLWLAEHGYDWYGGVDWPRAIGIIDKFVAVADRVAGQSKTPPPTFNDVLNNRFKPFCAHIASLIKKAKSVENWTIDPADLKVLRDLNTDLLVGCKKWKFRGDISSDKFTELATYHPWTPADYLKGEPTAQQRSAGKGDAVMKLRPRVRVNYNNK